MIQLASPQVWLFADTETTGLSPSAPKATILELGLLAVEVPAFREIDAWSSVVVAPDRASDVLEGADDYVRNMHTQSGLKSELEAALRPLASGGAIPDLASVQAKAVGSTTSEGPCTPSGWKRLTGSGRSDSPSSR